VFNWQDYIYIFVTLICRQLIIGVKYGFYSDYHCKMIETIALTPDFVSKALIISSLNEKSYELLK